MKQIKRSISWFDGIRDCVRVFYVLKDGLFRIVDNYGGGEEFVVTYNGSYIHNGDIAMKLLHDTWNSTVNDEAWIKKYSKGV